MKIVGFNKKVRHMKSKKDTEYVIEHIEMRKGFKIPLTSNAMLKTMFMSEKRIMYSAKFISYFIEDVDYEYLLKNLHFTKNDVSKNRNIDKSESVDYIAKLDEDLIGIEVNNNGAQWNLERNVEYATRTYAEKVIAGSNYQYSHVLQFNINNFTYDENDEDAIKVAGLTDNDGMLLTDKLIFIQIYLPNIRKKWYTKGVKVLTECEKYIMALVEPNLEMTKELGDDEVMLKYIREAEELSYSEPIMREYDREYSWKDEGRTEGKIEAKREIAISLLKKNVDKNIISECTGLSLKDLEELSI